MAHLRTGNPVIVYTDPPDRNYWTKNKHFFPVLEVQGNQGYVANPNSKSKTGFTDISTIMQDNVYVLFISK